MSRPDHGVAVAVLCALVVFVAAWGLCAAFDETAPLTAARCSP